MVRKEIIFTMCLVAMGILSGCGSSTKNAPETTEQAQSEEVYVGVMVPLTGNWAEHGKGIQIASTIAMEEINANGGINGKQLKLEYFDSEGDNSKATDVATSIADDSKFVAMMGGYSSGVCLSVAPIVEEYTIPFVSPSASNVDFAKSNDYCFSLGGDQKEQAPFLVSAAADYFGAKTVAIVGLNSEWGESSFQGAEMGSEQAGLDILFEEKYISGETDFSALITKIAATNPELIVILDQSPAVLINQIRSAGIEIPISICGSSISQEVIELAGENAEGCVVSTSPNAADGRNPEGLEFYNEFVERAGYVPAITSTIAYELTYLVADSIERTGDDINRENVRKEIAATDIEDSFIGKIKFNEYGNISRTYQLYQVKDQVWEAVEQ